MLKLRCALRPVALLHSPGAARSDTLRPSRLQPRAGFATNPQQQHPTFYEFRTYSIRPDQTSAFLKLTNEKIHLRTAYSELLGYWSVEYGGLNQVFHIWKYDSFVQRAGVRAALAQDTTWISDYLSKAIPMLTSQDNAITYLLSWLSLQRPPLEGGVFELVSFRMHPGGPTVWGDSFQAAVTAHNAAGYGKLLGAFHNEFGQINTVHALWWFENADRRAELRHKSHTDVRVVTAVRESMTHLDSQTSRLMYACPFSPMK